MVKTWRIQLQVRPAPPHKKWVTWSWFSIWWVICGAELANLTQGKVCLGWEEKIFFFIVSEMKVAVRQWPSRCEIHQCLKHRWARCFPCTWVFWSSFAGLSQFYFDVNDFYSLVDNWHGYWSSGFREMLAIQKCLFCLISANVFKTESGSAQ